MGGLSVRELGDYIRDQRRTAEVSLRQLARLAGVSNPYLSQIERGLRRPSAQILQQIAKALRISAETLYVQAGILDENGGVVAAIQSDSAIDERQKQVLLDIYRSFLDENATDTEPTAATGPTAAEPAEPAATEPTPAHSGTPTTATGEATP